MAKGKKKPVYQWDKQSIKALRQKMRKSQQEMAEELGTRQQTISEWEVGLYTPRGTSVAMLNIIAERAHFQYQAKLGEGTRKEANGE